MDRAWNCTANLPETSAAGPNLPLTLQLAPSRLSRSPLTAGATAPMVVAARTAGPCPPGHSGPPPRANQRISSPKTRGSSWYSTLLFLPTQSAARYARSTASGTMPLGEPDVGASRWACFTSLLRSYCTSPPGWIGGGFAPPQPRRQPDSPLRPAHSRQVSSSSAIAHGS